ncbi:IS30 family transposase [Halopseudomonas salegens]|uniref:Transposase and inactivated derivatives, IS30 family n=1 Tax=Halopseudomonas salegens TaxID=1434072 RepID=A0A1H2FGE1_9GAMM|nr:IS30 family transposase [Halopseudomonas salegens]SDU06375.1 Transposase and inactivated derivatives, IS30 family [Halopseudomonas salegens]
MKTYTHLTTDERVALMLMRNKGLSLRSISLHLGRNASSPSRELKRNSTGKHYDVIHACALARERRSIPRRQSRLLPDSEFFLVVRKMLKRGWSPQQIASRLKHQWPDSPEFHVSHESIYLAIYAHPRGELKRQLISYLRQGHGKRRRRTVNAERRERYPSELSIHLRPPEVEDRLIPGHWESDLIMGAGNRSAVATMVERTSRFVVLAKLDAPTAECASQAITREMNRLAPSLLKTMTHDQGSEMARYQDITAQTGMKIYFADPHSPWQRGSNENTNGLLRQYLPKGTDLSTVSQERLDEIANLLNTRPRQTLGWKFPVEVLVEYLQLSASNNLESIN